MSYRNARRPATWLMPKPPAMSLTMISCKRWQIGIQDKGSYSSDEQAVHHLWIKPLKGTDATTLSNRPSSRKIHVGQRSPCLSQRR
jgi:hypothetical protein